MNLAPIVLFVYNRPWHTEQTLNALEQNDLADGSVLYIYSDGPKENAKHEDLQKIQDVRKLVRAKNWCKEVHIIESEKNKGLANSIIEGVTEIVNKHGKIIVLEDDIVTSKGFLKFMNEALEMYQNEERVYHVSGYMYPMKGKANPGTVFLNVVTPWGWGTWADRWKMFVDDSNLLLQKTFGDPNFNEEEYNVGFGKEFSKQLIANANGSLKSWAVKWHTNIFLLGGFCLHPSKSLTSNIGMDGSGENCSSTDEYKSEIVDYIPVQRIELKQLKGTLISFKHFYEHQSRNPYKAKKPTLLNRLIKILK